MTTNLTIRTQDGHLLVLVGDPHKHALYLAVPGELSGDDTDFVPTTPELLVFLEEATKRVRLYLETKDIPEGWQRIEGQQGLCKNPQTGQVARLEELIARAKALRAEAYKYVM